MAQHLVHQDNDDACENSPLRYSSPRMMPPPHLFKKTHLYVVLLCKTTSEHAEHAIYNGQQI